MIRQEIIDAVNERADIVQIIGAHVQLRKSGVRYVGCCPFHNERTPSFYVFPNTGTYKCFGCGEGGDVIHFFQKQNNVTFSEAVKGLASQYGITIEEEQESTEAKQERLHREALLIALEKVAKYYREQFLQSKEAQAYAYNRWGEEYCTLIDMGFSPDDGRGISGLNIKTEFLKELGLVNRGGYDALHGRIVILIKDRSRRVIGFTARTMGDTQPKYLNSADSILFHKSKVLFGIDAAWRTAAKQEKFFLVEGAPDCMRLQSIGILNTVAVLGSAYGEQHYSIIKKVATKVCFLPDDDPPKQGEQFGHGIQVVMDAGKRAMECGLSVLVKEIPDGTNTHKQDPDSYYTSQNIFNAVEETDFILWLADKLFPLATTTEEQRQAVKRIANLLSLINDETGIQMYIGKLCKFYQGKRLWQQAVDAERKAREESAKREDDQRENDLYKRYGFYVDHGEYMSVNEKGGVYEWSNFTMMPLFHIKDNINPKRIYKIKNKMNVMELVELKQEDLVSLSKFKQKIEGLGNFIWKASEKELTKLKSFLYEKTETAVEITQLGWERAGFYAFGNGVFYETKFIPTDDYGIVRLKDIGNFWNVVQYLASDGELIEGGDFIIRCCRHLKTDVVDANWEAERPVLFLQKTRIFNLYRKEGRKTNDKVLPVDALKYYLQNHRSYLGQKVVRFDVYKKGMQQFEPVPGINMSPAKKTMTQRAFCFDYISLSEQFGINLGTAEPDESNAPF